MSFLVIRNAAKTNNKYGTVTFMVKAARASEISPPGAVKAYPAPKACKAKLKSSLAALECICIDEVPGGCSFYGHGGKPVWHNYRESFQLH